MARPRRLKNKPLVEAILEVRWALEPGPGPEFRRDPNYKFLLGKLRESIKPQYPYHEELPAALVPEEITPHVVHHRFRAEPNGWPLVQVGPGVFTVNDTAGYDWKSFERRINETILKLVEAYPNPENLKFETLMLRFINAVPLDFTKTDALRFLEDKMRTRVAVTPSMFNSETVIDTPTEVGINLGFPCKNPAGTILFKFNSGRRDGQPALIFEIWFVTKGSAVPAMPRGFPDWASGAHTIVEQSFFHLIEGELEKEFAGDE